MNHIMIDGSCVLCGGDGLSPCKDPQTGEEIVHMAVKTALAEHGWTTYLMLWYDAAQFVAEAVYGTLNKVWRGANQYMIVHGDSSGEHTHILYAFGPEIMCEVNNLLARVSVSNIHIEIAPSKDLSIRRVVHNALYVYSAEVGLTLHGAIEATADRIVEILKEH